MEVIYLHGFGSGPKSTKAAFFQRRLQQIGIPILVPDLNQGQFSQLTLTRQIQQVSQQLAEYAHPPVTLIGSSLGGWWRLGLPSNRLVCSVWCSWRRLLGF